VELWEAPIGASAHRHGIADEDIRHALRNLIAVAADPGDDDVTLFLGPDRPSTRSRSGCSRPTKAR